MRLPEQGMCVAQLMAPAPTVLRPEDTLERARSEMELGGIRHLPVVDREGRLVGVVSQRDLLAMGQDLHGKKVADLMVEDLVTVAPETLAHEAAYLILRLRVGSLPVTDGEGQLVGIITETDFVRVAHALLGGTAPPDEIEREEREAENV